MNPNLVFRNWNNLPFFWNFSELYFDNGILEDSGSKGIQKKRKKKVQTFKRVCCHGDEENCYYFSNCFKPLILENMSQGHHWVNFRAVNRFIIFLVCEFLPLSLSLLLLRTNFCEKHIKKWKQWTWTQIWFSETGII